MKNVEGVTSLVSNQRGKVDVRREFCLQDKALPLWCQTKEVTYINVQRIIRSAWSITSAVSNRRGNGFSLSKLI